MRKQIMQHTSDASVLSLPWLDAASLTQAELRITPDIQGGDACATLQELRLR